jgi:hypothetical protein
MQDDISRKGRCLQINVLVTTVLCEIFVLI